MYLVNIKAFFFFPHHSTSQKVGSQFFFLGALPSFSIYSSRVNIFTSKIDDEEEGLRGKTNWYFFFCDVK